MILYRLSIPSILSPVLILLSRFALAVQTLQVFQCQRSNCAGSVCPHLQGLCWTCGNDNTACAFALRRSVSCAGVIQACIIILSVCRNPRRSVGQLATLGIRSSVATVHGGDMKRAGLLVNSRLMRSAVRCHLVMCIPL